MIDSLQTRGVFGVRCEVEADCIRVGILAIDLDEDIPEIVELVATTDRQGDRYAVRLPSDRTLPYHYKAVLPRV
jgi:hypothetical protein